MEALFGRQGMLRKQVLKLQTRLRRASSRSPPYDLINELVVRTRLGLVLYPFLLRLCIAEENLAVRRPVPDRRGTVGRSRLLSRRHIIDPDPAHASRREKAGGHDLVATLTLLSLRLGFDRNRTLGLGRAR